MRPKRGLGAIASRNAHLDPAVFRSHRGLIQRDIGKVAPAIGRLAKFAETFRNRFESMDRSVASDEVREKESVMAFMGSDVEDHVAAPDEREKDLLG